MQLHSETCKPLFNYSLRDSTNLLIALIIIVLNIVMIMFIDY